METLPTDHNEPKVYTFQDLMEDTGLAFRLTMEELEDILSRFREEALISPKGVNLNITANRKKFISAAAKMSSNKTTLDGAGKKIVDGWKKQCGEVDARRKLIRDELDRLKIDIRAPVTEWERQETARLAEAARVAEAERLAEAEKSLRIAQDGREAPEAITLADAFQMAAQPPENTRFGASAHAAPSVPMLVLSKSPGEISFSDKETGALIYWTRRGDLGEWGAQLLFNNLVNARGARFWNTHGTELLRFDLSDVHGSL